jgi:hypothetical protein
MHEPAGSHRRQTPAATDVPARTAIRSSHAHPCTSRISFTITVHPGSMRAVSSPANSQLACRRARQLKVAFAQEAWRLYCESGLPSVPVSMLPHVTTRWPRTGSRFSHSAKPRPSSSVPTSMSPPTNRMSPAEMGRLRLTRCHRLYAMELRGARASARSGRQRLRLPSGTFMRSAWLAWSPCVSERMTASSCGRRAGLPGCNASAAPAVSASFWGLSVASFSCAEVVEPGLSAPRWLTVKSAPETARTEASRRRRRDGL